MNVGDDHCSSAKYLIFIYTLLFWDVEDAVPYNWLSEMSGIKFVPTSERRVSLRTEECAKHMGP